MAAKKRPECRSASTRPTQNEVASSPLGFETCAPGQQGVRVEINAIFASSNGGRPVLASNDVTLPSDEKFEPHTDSSSILDMSISDASRERGQRAMDAIRAAVKACARGGTRPEPRRVRELARLVDLFAVLAPRVPELCEYAEWLERNRVEGVLRRVFSGAGPGRPRASYLFVVGLVARVREQRQCSVAKAAHLIERQFGHELAMTARSIENAYSKYRDLLGVARGAHYVDGSELAP